MRIFIAACLSAVRSLALNSRKEVEKREARTRGFTGSLASQLASPGAGPFWAAWSEPMIPGRQSDMCWSNGAFNRNEHATGAPVRLEGQTRSWFNLAQDAENAQVDQIRMASLDCRFDGGGLPFYWLTPPYRLPKV